MNRFPALIAFVFIFSSCADHSKNEMAVFKAAQDGFIAMNQNISTSSLIIFRSMEEKLADPATRESAMRWEPKAEVIQKLSADLVKYINGLKNELTNGKEPGSEEYKKIISDNDNDDIVQTLFEVKNHGEELYSKLKKYKKEMLAVDSQINAEFEKHIGTISREFEFDEHRSKEFTQTYFHNIPVIGALVALGKFENNARIMENEFDLFCHNKIYSIHDGCGYGTRMLPMVTQDNSYVKGGEPIEITAGIVSYSPMSNPKVSINGKKIKSDYWGVVEYKLKTSTEPGVHVVPVKMEYVNPDGTITTFIKEITYTVAE